jgi:hypothetical protein
VRKDGTEAAELNVLPRHLPKPVWWSNQHKLIAKYESLGLHTPPGQYDNGKASGEMIDSPTLSPLDPKNQ